MACGSCGGSRRLKDDGTAAVVKYRATYRDGVVEDFNTVGQAKEAIKKRGGGTFKAVTA